MWVLLWLSPHEKREFGARTATAARGRDPDIDGERALRRTCDASIPPSHQRHNRRDVPISHPTSLAFETEPSDPTARRLSVPPNGRDAAAARALEERKNSMWGVVSINTACWWFSINKGSSDFGFACPGSARASGDVSPYKPRDPPTTHRERASAHRTSTNSARCANHVEGHFLKKCAVT